jgi:hypothetical protein
MNLLLAYSASHRARMLNQPEPANRIAVWVQDVFPKLRQSLTENPNHISNSTLAAVIMMASLEIIASNTFEVPISWQSHLQMARQMVMARGGPRGMDRQDRVAYFLSRWFAYLDVLGSLSGNKNDTPLGSFYWSSENASADQDFEIDCLMGFTNRCVGSLAKISELAKLCEPLRIDGDGNIRQNWHPSPEIYDQAMHIRHELEEGLSDQHIHKGCNHRSDAEAESEGAWDATEIYATNEMFHWGGLIHLYRRVLGKPATDVEVQSAIHEIVALLYKVRRGSSAEACLLFPMFVAGCDAQDEGQREKIMERLRGVEGFGMTQVSSLDMSVTALCANVLVRLTERDPSCAVSGTPGNRGKLSSLVSFSGENYCSAEADLSGIAHYRYERRRKTRKIFDMLSLYSTSQETYDLLPVYHRMFNRYPEVDYPVQHF